MQDQVEKLEDSLDQLNADFAQQSHAIMNLQEEIAQQEKEMATQMELANQGNASAKQSQKETVNKLNALKSQLTNLTMKKSATSDRLEECQKELETTQGELAAAASGKPAAKSAAGKKK